MIVGGLAAGFRRPSRFCQQQGITQETRNRSIEAWLPPRFTACGPFVALVDDRGDFIRAAGAIGRPWVIPATALGRHTDLSTGPSLALILASTSSIRAHLLREAGVEFRILPPKLDEAPIKQAHRGDGETLARRLAEGKALSVAVSAELAIGSDSVVEVDGRAFSKPRDRAEAAAHLAAFSGRSMLLSSAVALARGGDVEWSHAETAHLVVRPLSSRFIEAYLDAEWPAVGNCVGVFRMEGRGVTLFDRIEGSHFTILGLPLLPLLAALRERGAMPS